MTTVLYLLVIVTHLMRADITDDQIRTIRKLTQNLNKLKVKIKNNQPSEPKKNLPVS